MGVDYLALGDVEGLITFTYYENLERASKFYSDIMGFELVIDVDFAKVYKISENAHIGIVDGNKGLLKATRDKPVMLSFIVNDVDTWYNYLIDKGVKINNSPQEADYLKMKVLLLEDPEGYVIEILEFLTKPYGLN